MELYRLSYILIIISAYIKMGRKRTPRWIKILIAIIIILLIVDIILNLCFGITLDPVDRLLFKK